MYIAQIHKKVIIGMPLWTTIKPLFLYIDRREMKIISNLFQSAFPIKKSSARYSENAANPPSSSKADFLNTQDIPLAQFRPIRFAQR